MFTRAIGTVVEDRRRRNTASRRLHTASGACRVAANIGGGSRRMHSAQSLSCHGERRGLVTASRAPRAEPIVSWRTLEKRAQRKRVVSPPARPRRVEANTEVMSWYRVHTEESTSCQGERSRRGAASPRRGRIVSGGTRKSRPRRARRAAANTEVAL
jgi:hypothetical protein